MGITLVDAQSILEFITTIKKEDGIDKNNVSLNEYLPIKCVYDVWSEMCKVNEIRFKLLPQHIRDYNKPAPTYYPPPQHSYGYGTQSAYNNTNRNKYGMNNSRGGVYGGDNGSDDGTGTPPLYELKPVMEWNTEDCINWLGQIRESKVDLRVRYTPHFEHLKMNGQILINMTPSTLSSICCITTKTHLKQ